MGSTELMRAEQAIENITPIVMDVTAKARALANINDHKSFMEADSFLAELKRVQKKLDDERKRFTGPLDLAKSQIMEVYKPKALLISEAEMILKGATRKWYLAEEERKRKEEERLRAEARKREEDERLRKAEELEKHGNKMQADAVISEPIVDVKPKVQTSFDQGKSYGRKVWKARVVSRDDFLRGVIKGEVPGSFFEININEMNKAATALKGQVSWPGVQIVEDVIMGVRR